MPVRVALLGTSPISIRSGTSALLTETAVASFGDRVPRATMAVRVSSDRRFIEQPHMQRDEWGPPFFLKPLSSVVDNHLSIQNL